MLSALRKSLISPTFSFLPHKGEIIRLNSSEFLEINEDYPNENKQITYSELAVTRESAASPCIRPVTQRQAASWEKKVSDRVRLETVIMAKLKFSQLEVGAPYVIGLGADLTFFLIGSQLEAGAKNRELGTH